MRAWRSLAVCVLALGVGASHGHVLAQEPPLAAGMTKAERRHEYDFMCEAIQHADDSWAAGDFAAQIGALEEAAEKLSDPTYKTTILVRLADALRERGRNTRALDIAREAEAVLMDGANGDPLPDSWLRLLCYVRGVEAQIYVDWGLIDIAYTKVEEMRSLLASLAETLEPQYRERLQFDWVMALVLAANHDYGGVERHVVSALEQRMYVEFPREAGLLHERLGLSLREMARTDPTRAPAARAELELALSEKFRFTDSQRIAPELALAELALLDGDMKSARAWFDRATLHMGDPALRGNHPRRAGWAATAARLVFERKSPPADRAELEATRATLEATMRTRLDAWRAREQRVGGYGFLRYPDERALISELIRLDLALEPEQIRVERALGRVSATGEVSTLARALGAEKATLARARTELLGDRADHVLLVYFRAPNRSHLFVVGKEIAEHFPLDAADFIDEVRVAAVEALQRPAEADLPAGRRAERERKLATLASMLLPPKSRPLLEKSSRLTVVGLDLFDTVPFEALPWSDEQTLGTAKAIAHLPSLAVGLALAERARNERRPRPGDVESGVLLVAAPKTSQLDVSASALKRLLDVYPERCRAFAIGADANIERLRSGVSNAYVLQLLSHGKYDLTRERSATIVLDAPGGDGGALLGADEVEELEAGPLVVFTACSAGNAPTRRGDGGAADLTGACFRAGKRARCVALSSFDLDVHAALRISASFHAAVAKGIDPAEALRASNAALAADPDYADPFFHGLMRIVGIGHVPVFAR